MRNAGTCSTDECTVTLAIQQVCKYSRCGLCFFFQAEDGIRYLTVTGVQTCALPIYGAEDVSDPIRRHLTDPDADRVLPSGRVGSNLLCGRRDRRGRGLAVLDVDRREEDRKSVV